MKCEVCRYGGYCPFCYEGMKARRYHKGHYGYRKAMPRKEDDVSKFLRQSGGVNEPEGADHRPEGTDTRWVGECPALAEYLFTSRDDQGKIRQRATLLVFYEDGLCKVCLNDRASGASLWRSGESFEAAIRALEHSLQRGDGDWRRSPSVASRKR